MQEGLILLFHFLLFVIRNPMKGVTYSPVGGSFREHIHIKIIKSIGICSGDITLSL